jgi:hypothetical protein
MTTKSDVWPLGCVLSVVFAYLEEGAAGVEAYSVARLEHPRAGTHDRFFVRGKLVPNQLHPEVHRWHTQLIQKASQRGVAEAKIVKDVLRSVENDALEVDPEKRCDAKKMRDLLKAAAKAYRSLGVDEDSTSSSFSRFPIRKHRRILNTVERGDDSSQSPKAKVDSWHISPDENFKGCEISPDGSLVAYWTDNKIELYTRQSLPLREGDNVTPTSSYSLAKSENCIWKSISLTQRYLVASTTGSSFNVC